MSSKRRAKYCLTNYHCGRCETGIVQVFQQAKRGGIVTSTVSGCLDCKHEYGLLQASKLEICKPDTEIYWI